MFTSKYIIIQESGHLHCWTTVTSECRMQQLLSSSWPSCTPVWDKNAITGNRKWKKFQLTHNRATSAHSTHT